MELEDFNENSTEEGITHSKLKILKYSSTQTCPSKNIFQEISPEATRPDSKTKTHLHSFTGFPKPSVFDRLVSDSNRRTLNISKIQSFRKSQETDPLLSPSYLSKESEINLLERLRNDTSRRRLEQQARDLKKTESPKTTSRKQSPEKTEKMIERLFIDKRQKHQNREKAKMFNIEAEILALKKIREKRHPSRKLNTESLERMSHRSPSCKHAKVEDKRIKKSWTEVKKIVERLHKSPERTAKVPSVESYFSYIKEGRKSLIRNFDLEADDFMLSLKAKGGHPLKTEGKR